MQITWMKNDPIKLTNKNEKIQTFSYKTQFIIIMDGQGEVFSQLLT